MFTQSQLMASNINRALMRAADKANELKHARDRYYGVYEQKYIQCTSDAQRQLLREFSATLSISSLRVYEIDESTKTLSQYNPLAH